MELIYSSKSDKVVSTLSHLDFEMALYFLRSSGHDLYAICWIKSMETKD